MITTDLVFVISPMLLVMPCDPMPLSLKPWKGKWSGPLAGAPLICTVPVDMAWASLMALSMSREKTDPCSA